MDKPKNKKLKSGLLEMSGDWVGVFIRGEEAQDYAIALENLLRDNPQDNLILKNLLKLLHSTSATSFAEPVKFKTFEECVKKPAQSFWDNLRKTKPLKTESINKTTPPKFQIDEEIQIIARITEEVNAFLKKGLITDMRHTNGTWEYRVVVLETGEHFNFLESQLKQIQTN